MPGPPKPEATDVIADDPPQKGWRCRSAPTLHFTAEFALHNWRVKDPSHKPRGSVVVRIGIGRKASSSSQ